MDPNLYKAASLGDIYYLSTALSLHNGSILHQTTSKGNNLLHMAAEFKQFTFFKEVIQKDLQLLGNKNSKGETPLHVAARVGSTEIIKFIINSSQNLSDVETQIAEYHKNQLREITDDNDNALHIAARNGHDDIVKLLLSACSELSCHENYAKESPLFMAVDRNFPLLAEYILSNAPSPSYSGSNGMTALHAATMRKLNGNLKKIAWRQANLIKVIDSIGWTPLHYAACYDNLEATKLFLLYNSSATSILDVDGESALHVAAFKGNTNIMEELIQCRPDISESTDKKGRTALHAAILGDQEKAVKYILTAPKLQGLINEVDNDGNTALHLAAIHDKRKIIKIIASDRRADKRAVNKRLLTARDSFEEIVKMLDLSATKILYILGPPSLPYLQKEIESGKGKIERGQSLNKGILTTACSTTAKSTTSTTSASSPDPDTVRSMLDTHLLVATLIATVAFQAVFTPPKHGGEPNLMETIALKVFVVSDAISFFLSTAAIYIQFYTARAFPERVKSIKASIILIIYAIVGMMLTFSSGLCVILARSNLLASIPYLMFGCFFLINFCYWFVDPLGLDFLVPMRWRISLRDLLLHNKLI